MHDYVTYRFLLLIRVVTRNSSGDEIANVNFVYDDIVHILQNTIDSCINSAKDRRGCYVLSSSSSFSLMTIKLTSATSYNAKIQK